MADSSPKTHKLDSLTSSLLLVSDHLFTQAKKQKEESGALSDDILKALHFIHGPSFLSALDLVDREAVRHVTTPSGRGVHQVKSSSGNNHYTCRVSPKASCSCPSFTFCTSDIMYCKHLLAVKMTQVVGSVRTETMSDEAFKELFETNTNP